jgi:hypothetical protein
MSDLAKVLQVAGFAANLKRRSGDYEPANTLKHAVFMAAYLANEVGMAEADMMCATLLHDCYTTTRLPADFIATHFGSDVGKIVAEVTRINPKFSNAARVEKILGGDPLNEKARLILLIDAYITVRELQSDPPSEWPLIRIQATIAHAKDRADQIRGVHSITESRFDELCSLMPLEDIKHPNRYHWRSREYVERMKALNR